MNYKQHKMWMEIKSFSCMGYRDYWGEYDCNAPYYTECESCVVNGGPIVPLWHENSQPKIIDRPHVRRFLEKAYRDRMKKQKNKTKNALYLS